MVRYFLTPAAARHPETASQVIYGQLKRGTYSWRRNTPHVRDLRPGDRIAFYATGRVGVVATAEVTSRAVDSGGEEPFPMRFGVRLWRPVIPPVRIDADLRARLDKLRGEESPGWPGLVRRTQKISAHDFRLLTDSE